MEAIEVTVEGRHLKGSSSVKRERRAGNIPAVIYARGAEARMLTLKEQEFVRRVAGCGPTQLFKLKSEVKDFDGQLVLIKDLQMEPIKGKVLHLDFLALSIDQRITVEVPIELQGESPAVKSGEFILNVSSHKVSVECLPTEIPKVIMVDISGLAGAQSIHASDLVLPQNIKLKTDPGKSIVSTVHKKEEIESAPVAAAADAAAVPGAEGAAPAADAAAAGAAGGKTEKAEKSDKEVGQVKAVVGLGNPGKRYVGTRHNVGFEFIERLRQKLEFAEWKKFDGCEIASGRAAGDAALLIKPLQYMNCSGEALTPVVNYYRIRLEELIVCYDELDFRPGVIKLKLGGRAAGHLGVTSMLESFSEDGFYRLRIGIGHPRDDAASGGKIDVSDWVLGRPGAEERQLLDLAIERGLKGIERFLQGEIEAAKKLLAA